MLKTILFGAAIMALHIHPTQARAGSVNDNYSCLALIVLRDAPGFLSEASRIRLDAYIHGAAVNRPLPDVFVAFERACLAEPKLSVVNAMRRALSSLDGG